ncbi:MAG: nucleotide exchange factor GrpE [Deltaproteobacteria bacterium]|jgi:molecular chaperone GrpE|nr:nucleotide exchange factor GrpE [Deltaproteobacteria bacterium]
MNKKNPYGMGSDFDPDDILQNFQGRPGVPHMDFNTPQDVFTSASAGRPYSQPDNQPDSPDSQQANQVDQVEPGQGHGQNLTYEELDALAKEHLCPTCPAAKDAEDLRLRSLAELDNVRKRILKEKDEAIKFAASQVLSDIIPVLDNLDLALEHARGQVACKDFFIGVEMTKKVMLEVLKKHGLLPIGGAGDVFDPSVHEAVGTNPDPNVEDGAIITILNKGYKLHDRLLRPARVIVCKK